MSPGDDPRSRPDVVVGRPTIHRNLSAEAAGSIHDDHTASSLGFRGGTVAASIHLEAVPPLALEVLGPRWWREGTVSLYFRHATVDGEAVVAVVERPLSPVGERGPVGPLGAWLVTTDGAVVAEGTVSLGDPRQPSALQARDLRPVADASELTLLSGVAPGVHLDAGLASIDPRRQQARLAAGLSEDLPAYHPRAGAPAVASPIEVVDLLHRPIPLLADRIGSSVGLWGAIELSARCGPVLVGVPYHVHGRVAAVSRSPRSELLWFDAFADDTEQGHAVATMRILVRFLPRA